MHNSPETGLAGSYRSGRTATDTRLIQMENFGGVGPDFSFCPGVWQRSLAGIGFSPPAPRLGIRGHFCHVTFKITAGVFEIGEEIIPAIDLLYKNRVIPDMAAAYLLADRGPRMGVELLIVSSLFRSESGDGAKSLHLAVRRGTARTKQAEQRNGNNVFQVGLDVFHKGDSLAKYVVKNGKGNEDQSAEEPVIGEEIALQWIAQWLPPALPDQEACFLLERLGKYK